MALSIGAIIMFVDWWSYLAPWNWLFIAIVCFIGGFWTELVLEPRAKRKALQMLREWTDQERKAFLAERKRG